MHRHLSNALTTAGTTITQGAINWESKVVKHLAVISAAGLAGATALYSSPSKMAALGAVTYFLVGLLIAATMVSIYFVRLIYSGCFSRGLIAVICNLSRLGAAKPPSWLIVLIGVDWLLAGCSIASFVLGVVRLTVVV